MLHFSCEKGTAPIIKNRLHNIFAISYKGEKPIEKNIIVVDKNGNEYEATYPKRAKGLVKNGRARFISENKICLACPPDKSEDKKMSDKNIKPENSAAEAPDKLTMNYVLEQIERISKDTEYLYNTIQKLGEMSNASGPGDIVGRAKAEALGNVVECRETTNQQLLKMYEKMYDDLKPQPPLKEKALEVINRTLNNPTCGESEKEALSDMLDTVRHLSPEPQSTDPISRFAEITDWVKTLNKDEFDPAMWEAITQAIQAQFSRNG